MMKIPSTALGLEILQQKSHVPETYLIQGKLATKYFI